MLEAEWAPPIWDMHGCPPRAEGADLSRVLERYRAAGFEAVTVNANDPSSGDSVATRFTSWATSSQR